MTSRFLFLSLICLPPALAADEVDYAREVKPLLEHKCFVCHGVRKQESSLRVDTVDAMRAGGESGEAIVPGNAAASLLIERVTSDDPDERMPPDGEGERLDANQIALLTNWINQGATAPADEKPEADPRDHWAYQRPIRSKLTSDGNPVDVLLDVARQKRDLQTVAPVETSLLLRRVYLDLIGLPPTRGETREFLADESSHAFENVVDRLLDSPHYGERWGRHWMDIWRYTDWFGLGAQLRYSQKHIWHWRDWIVESLNADKGYDQMVVEMLAADEIAPANRQTLRAGGFLARNYFLFNRTTWLDNTIEHTSKAFLGLTMNCVKCHGHKYDPIAHEEYYRMRAFFEPHQIRLDQMPGQHDLEKDGLPRAYDCDLEAPTYVHLRGTTPDESRVLEPGVPAVFGLDLPRITPVELPTEAHNPALRAHVLDDQIRGAKAGIKSARTALETARMEKEKPSAADVLIAEKELAAARLKPELLRTAHAADRAKHEDPPPEDLDTLIQRAAVAARKHELATAELTLAQALKKVEDANDKSKEQPKKELAKAQDALKNAQKAVENPGEKYTSLRASRKAKDGPDESNESRIKPFPKTSTGRRTALARWITDRKNPLTARVAVNHIWLRHFGQPLVEPVTDFGLRAKRPSQQALLDWLAVELMENGWSMKHLHRLIVTSHTYRLSTSSLGAADATQKADPENECYWRRRPVRMESQVVRDSLLKLAGVLDPKLGGPTIDPGKADTHYRRSIYFTLSRDHKHKFISMFDDVDILRCYRREESVVPQQALAMSNSKLALTMARKISPALEKKCETDVEFVRLAFEATLCRQPDDDELKECVDTLDQMLKISEKDKTSAVSRARANLVHVLLNHNDFITIR